MKKEIKTQYGIQIVKPWSKEMYAHNEVVAEVVRSTVWDMWSIAIAQFEQSCESDEDVELEVLDLDWECVSDRMIEIQRAITCYGFGSGYDVSRVSDQVLQELDNAPLFRLKEIAEELELKLEQEFIGFN